MDYARKKTSRSGIHVLHRVEAKTIDIGESNPEFVYFAESKQGR